jgi:hypothetical protein
MASLLTCVNAFKQSLTGGSFEALSAATKDSLQIVSTGDPNTPAGWIEETWAGNSASKMECEIFSQRFGDNQNGFRFQQMFNPTMSGADGVPQLGFPRTVDVPVWSADTLNVSVNGTASDNANVGFQIYYQNFQGSEQRLAPYGLVESTVKAGIAGNSRVLGIEVTVTPGTTGNYGTAVALNANDDRLQADYDYALIGYTCQAPVMMFGISGPDTGQYRIPMPGHWDARHTSDWFLQASRWRQSPRVPIINANNTGQTLIDAIDPANPGATKLSLYFAQLPNKFQG